MHQHKYGDFSGSWFDLQFGQWHPFQAVLCEKPWKIFNDVKLDLATHD